MAVIDMFSQSAPGEAPVPPPPGSPVPPPITPAPSPGFFSAPPPPSAVAATNFANNPALGNINPTPAPNVAPTPESAPPTNNMINTDDTTPPNEPLTDSFGEPIKPEDVKLENASPKPPAFVEGALAGMPNMPSPAIVATTTTDQAPAGSAPTAPSMSTSKEKTFSGLPPIVIVIMHIGVLGLIGLAVFALWYSQFQKIEELNGRVRGLINDSNDLSTQLVQARTEMELSKQTPVFLQEDGDFSFNQSIPNLVVTETDLGADVEFGEVVDGKPVNGFMMRIEGRQTNGQALSDIVDGEMAEKIDDATRDHKQDEGTRCYPADIGGETCYLSDKVGFSYEERGNDYWKVIYLLRNDPHATYYLRIEFSSAGQTEASQNEYGQIGGQLLSSIKIYR